MPWRSQDTLQRSSQRAHDLQGMVDTFPLLLPLHGQLAICLGPLVLPASTPSVACISDALLPWSGQGHENTYHPHDVSTLWTAPKLCILQKHIQQDEIWEVECKPTSPELSLNARREDLHVVIMQYVYALSNKKIQTTKVVKVNANDCNSIAIVLLASIARKGSAASKARLHPSTNI